MNRESIFFALSSYNCRCETQFDSQCVEIADPPARDKFEPDEIDWNIEPDDSTGAAYTCPECDLDWTGRVEKHGEKLEILLQSEDGLQKRGISRETAILLDHSEGQHIMELLSELDTSAAVLQRHFERLDSHTQTHVFDIEQEDKIDIISDIKAYLAEAYSFKMTFQTLLRQDLPEKDRAQRLFEDYNKRSKVVNGLRIYTQKERNLLPDLRAVDQTRITPIVEVESVEVMDSQVSIELPDGYRNGHEEYYGHLTDDEIDLHALLKDHVNDVQWFVRELAKAIAGPDSEAHDDIEEWVDLREQYLTSLYPPLDEN
jgi:hypothetical protein